MTKKSEPKKSAIAKPISLIKPDSNDVLPIKVQLELAKNFDNQKKQVSNDQKLSQTNQNKTSNNQTEKVSTDTLDTTTSDNSIIGEDGSANAKPVEKLSHDNINKKTFTTTMGGREVELIEELPTPSSIGEKRKPGRPKGTTKKALRLKATEKLALRLNKNSIFYFQVLSQSFSRTELEQYVKTLNNPTIAEKMAVDLLLDASNGEKKAVDRYWKISQNIAQKQQENSTKQPKSGTILDDILGEVEADVFGDIPEADLSDSPHPC